VATVYHGLSPNVSRFSLARGQPTLRFPPAHIPGEGLERAIRALPRGARPRGSRSTWCAARATPRPRS